MSREEQESKKVKRAKAKKVEKEEVVETPKAVPETKEEPKELKVYCQKCRHRDNRRSSQTPGWCELKRKHVARKIVACESVELRRK